LRRPSVKLFCGPVPVNDLPLGIDGYNRLPNLVEQPRLETDLLLGFPTLGYVLRYSLEVQRLAVFVV
jgi:hypothetical protein